MRVGSQALKMKTSKANISRLGNTPPAKLRLHMCKVRLPTIKKNS